MKSKMARRARVLSALEDQKARARWEREQWDELKRLAEACDILGFYTKYARYLENCNVISPSRIVLHKMAKLVSEKLDGN